MAGEDKGELLLRYWGNDSVEQQEPQEQPVGRHSMDGAAAFAAPTLEHNHSDTAEVNAESVDALECWLELNLPDDLVFTDNNCNALLASVQLPDQAPVMMDCDGFEDYVQHYTQSLAESMLVEDSSISAPITEQDAYDLINVRATSESSTVPSEPTKPFACFFDQCESRFAKKAHLIDHERVHTGEKPFVCDVDSCGKAFTQRGSLSVHVRMHTNAKPVECLESCGKTFTKRGHMLVHLRSHQGIKPYKCSFTTCYKTFTQSQHLKRHVQKLHASVGHEQVDSHSQTSLDPFDEKGMIE